MARILPHEAALIREREEARRARARLGARSPGVGSTMPVGTRMPTPEEAIVAERAKEPEPNPALSAPVELPVVDYPPAEPPAPEPQPDPQPEPSQPDGPAFPT